MTNFESDMLSYKSRHIGPDETSLKKMLKEIGCDSLDQLIDETVPSNIRLKEPLNLPEAMSEYQYLQEIAEIAKKNKIWRSYIGLGYYDCITPSVILRNIFENPGWYTQYTPYQAEISQGRLEALLNFQTMVSDLTGLPIANASLLDEGTAAAEAMTMLHRLRSREMQKNGAHTFFVDNGVFPQTRAVLKTRAKPLGIELVFGDFQSFEFDGQVFGALVQYPAEDGQIHDYREFIELAHQNGSLVTVAADLMSLALLVPPGEMGADVVIGSSQRFGVPLGYGGPHAAYFATREEFKRQVPGRIIGVSIDRHGNPAFRMALQTREQHIRREKATSNICTAQSLLAIMAGMYAVYHGPEGLKAIANQIHQLTRTLDEGIRQLGFKQLNSAYFDTLKIEVSSDQLDKIRSAAEKAEINLRYMANEQIGISLDETTGLEDVQDLLNIFAVTVNKTIEAVQIQSQLDEGYAFPVNLRRNSDFLIHPVFNSYHTETKMLRYIKQLENKDLSLTISMIPLGSCTMKLNPATAMIPVSWPEFARIHPFVPLEQARGYQEIIEKLENYLCEITGFSAASLQPNSGAQGEFTGLSVIRAYFESKGEAHRNIVLIPASAHGTNPASAAMAGMKVVVVKCNEKGDVDLEDLQEKAERNRDNLAALMITYPSTHGVFEDDIKEICRIIHENGGQVYMDGANMNAQVGLTSPKEIGADICHLNLHKTFGIPHGGGGPGVGPICCAEHLAPFLPGHPIIPIGSKKAIEAVASTPWGSASILLISYAYIRMMGKEGLTKASKYAILNANYIKARLEKYYPVLYSGSRGRVGHELIFDLRPIKRNLGIEAEDIAKRLMDYGFHAPTVSFPVLGTFMVEPTESESKDELDRFCDAMISIYHEIEDIKAGKADPQDNVLKNAPHTAREIASDEWNHPYSRKQAAFPAKYVEKNKFWPAVGRIDHTYGDRHLICTCPPIEAYESED